MVQVGFPLGEGGPRVPMARVANREVEIIGSHGADAADFPAILQLVVEGKLRPEELVAREVGLAEGAAAIQALEDGSPVA